MICLVTFQITILIFICSELYATNPCEIHKTCSNCVLDFHGCKWCFKDNYTGSRCTSVQNTFKECSENLVENPISQIWRTGSLDFGSSSNKVTQIKPQSYKIKLRPGQTIDFDFYFKLSKDYPADLYFLIDASASMARIIETIGDTAVEIYEEMVRNTRNVNLGVGTFIDKYALPYIARDKGRDQTYSYRNRLSLTNESQKFRTVVKNMPLGSNYDRLEGGFDAIAQVLACENQVGWRDPSRKILVFLTDQQYHSAGDGKWAGIVQPYDGKCYTENNIYTKELDMDYPSIGIINKLATDLEATIIFGVKDVGTNLKVYETLSKLVQGSRYFGYKEIRNAVVIDNSQIKTILSTIYNDLTHNIKLRTIMTSRDRKYVNITITPSCDSKINSNECKVTYDEEKYFKGKIKLSEYYSKDKIPVEIIIEGIKEKLILDVEVVKQCNCETNERKIDENSEYCNSAGHKRCGICKCNANRYGDRCACSATNGSLSDDATCRADGLQTQLCSGRGSCFCGTCQCLPGFDGQYCECNKINCPQQCSRHGECKCGKCMCFQGWTGEACDCSLAGCLIEYDKECNGRGSCICGQCLCQPLEPWDARVMQTKSCKAIPCLDCYTEQCKLLQPCALCHFHNNTDCETICTTVNVTKVLHDHYNMHYPKDDFKLKDQGWYDCENFKVDIGCYSKFKYRYAGQENRLDLVILSEQDCVENYYVFGGTFLVGLLLVGLATLIVWKLLTDARDRREYERFVKQHTESKRNAVANPIYEPASVTYRNPAFRNSIFNR